MPGRIELLESTVQELHLAMADPSYYRKDRDEIAAAKKRLENLEHDLAAAYALARPGRDCRGQSIVRALASVLQAAPCERLGRGSPSGERLRQ